MFEIERLDANVQTSPKLLKLFGGAISIFFFHLLKNKILVNDDFGIEIGVGKKKPFLPWT